MPQLLSSAAQVKQAELERDEAQTKCQELSAQLVEAGHNEDAWRAQLSKAVAEEREACAKMCEQIDLEYEGDDRINMKYSHVQLRSMASTFYCLHRRLVILAGTILFQSFQSKQGYLKV